MWEKPSTGEEAQMIAYVVGLQDWQWAVGTGVFIDDVIASIATSRMEVENRVRRTFIYRCDHAGGADLCVRLRHVIEHPRAQAGRC